MTSPETTEDGALTGVVKPEHDRQQPTKETIRLLGICGSLRASSEVESRDTPTAP